MYSCGSCFLWSCFSSQNFGDVFPCTKKSMMKKRYVFAKKNVRGRDAFAHSAHAHRIQEMAQTRPHCPTQTNRIQAKWRSVWGRALELALQVGPQLRNPTIGKPHLARHVMVEVRETTRLKRLLQHGLQEIIWCQMDVVVVACAVLLDVNACSGPCHPTTPTTYYIVLVSRIQGAGYVQRTH